MAGETKLIQIIRWASGIYSIIVPIAAILYFVWMLYTIPLIFLLKDFTLISWLWGIVLLVGYILMVPVLKYTNRLTTFGAILFGITTPFLPIFIMGNFEMPTILDSIAANDGNYYLLTREVSILELAHPSYGLHQCKKNGLQCERTPFGERDGSFSRLHLMIDQTGDPNEVHVMETLYSGFTILEYTYGAHPRYYDYPAELDEHLYYLAYIYNSKPRSAIFMLYECKLDNTSCKQLPFQYQGWGIFRNVKANEETHEVSIFIDTQANQNTLIFTYGEHPRCYVQGCKITDK